VIAAILITLVLLALIALPVALDLLGELLDREGEG
jgi:hypothetical protein